MIAAAMGNDYATVPYPIIIDSGVVGSAVANGLVSTCKITKRTNERQDIFSSQWQFNQERRRESSIHDYKRRTMEEHDLPSL